MKTITRMMITVLLFVMTLSATAQVFISDVKLIGGSASEVSSLVSTSKNSGWTVIEKNLNQGTRGDVIYLCYKTCRNTGNGITHLYLSSKNNPVPNTLTANGCTYTICPYEGGGHFVGIKGDLNSNNGGADIHLYYTKATFSDKRVLTDIQVNATRNGAIGLDQSSTPYDLNKGTGGADVFLHISTTASSESSSTPFIPTSTSSGYISDVKLIGGSASEVSSLVSSSKNNGWTVIEKNLNQGTRGDVIYLCYKTSRNTGNGITHLYLSSKNNPVPNTLTANGCTYTICPYEGGGHFVGIKGDLNSNNGGADIHLYYTKATFSDKRVLTDIQVNATRNGAIGLDQSSTPYDLNKGTGGADVFIHITQQ